LSLGVGYQAWVLRSLAARPSPWVHRADKPGLPVYPMPLAVGCA